MKEDNISQLGDYDAPFCEQQYTHGSQGGGGGAHVKILTGMLVLFFWV